MADDGQPKARPRPDEPCVEHVAPDSVDSVSDEAIETLLREVYVSGGFTDPEVAREALSAPQVRARGKLLALRRGEALLGMVMVVTPTDAGHRMGAPDEAEMHLLAVHPSQRRRGFGARLVSASVALARDLGFTKMVLWTQPGMLAAQRLYGAAGFTRAPTRDFEHVGRRFLVFERHLAC